MRRALLCVAARSFFGLAGLVLASAAHAQLVPLARCNGALPCSIPFGLRPADSVAFSPYARTGQGNTAVSVSAAVDELLKPRVDTPHVAEDPSERAARIFVKRNPIKPTPTPTAARKTP